MEEFTWNSVIMIPNGNNEFFRIGLLEILWKTVMGILNRRLTLEIQYHGNLDGFCAGIGMGIASLGANLIQNSTDMR